MRNRLKALLDANVLFSNQQRNLLLELASQEVITVFWTEMIEDEWLRNAAEGTRDRIRARTLPLIRGHFPDALIAGFDPFVEIGRTDAKDRHVASAAVRSAPCVLVTWNTKHFDADELAKNGVTVETPDAFLAALYDADPAVIHDVTKVAQGNLTKSAPTWDAYLGTLSSKHGLKRFADRLRRFEPSTQQDIDLISGIGDAASELSDESPEQKADQTKGPSEAGHDDR
jgi:hypothetical protein